MKLARRNNNSVEAGYRGGGLLDAGAAKADGTPCRRPAQRTAAPKLIKAKYD